MGGLELIWLSASQPRRGQPWSVSESALDLGVAGGRASGTGPRCAAPQSPRSGAPCPCAMPEVSTLASVSSELVCKGSLVGQGSAQERAHLVPSALSTGTGLVRMHRGGSVILRNISDQRTLSYAFFLVLLPRVSQPLTPKRMTAWKGTLTQPLVPFPSGLSLLVGEQKAECWEAGHVSRSEVETVELDLYRVVCRSGKSHRICKCQGIKYQCVILKM